MQVLMLSWEYPPFSVGGLSQHVYELSRAMVEEGAGVEVVTTATAPPFEEVVKGVIVHRVLPYPGRELSFISWVQQLNLAMMEKGASLMNRVGNFDIIHGHDWLVAHACRGLKHIFHIPFISTIHATEHGRNGGLFTEEQQYIGDVEWHLAYESWKTICCSSFMEDELVAVFQMPRDKIEIIPNGVRQESFRISRPDTSVRDRYAPNGEKIIFYVGRLVREKGVQDLINAVPVIREQTPGIKVVIAGTGPHEEELQRQVISQGLESYVNFTGYVDDYTRNQLYHWASVAVFPSHYEPFGIVALEGMATGTPVVVGDTGGFREIINDGENGLKATPGNHVSIAEQISLLLMSPDMHGKLSKNGPEEIQRKYSWKKIARDTLEIYRSISSSAEARSWQEELKTEKEKEKIIRSRETVR